MAGPQVLPLNNEFPWDNRENEGRRSFKKKTQQNILEQKVTNYQFEMTPWVPTTVDKTTSVPRKIIMKIQNTGDKSGSYKVPNVGQATSHRWLRTNIRMALDLTILKTSTPGYNAFKIPKWRDFWPKIVYQANLSGSMKMEKSHFLPCKISKKICYPCTLPQECSGGRTPLKWGCKSRERTTRRRRHGSGWGWRKPRVVAVRQAETLPSM